MTGCSFKKGLYEFHMEAPRCCIPCDHLEVPGAPEHSWEATTMASSLVTFAFLKTCHAEQAETRTRKKRGIFRVVVTWLGLLTMASDVVQGSGSCLSLEQTCGSEQWVEVPSWLAIAGPYRVHGPSSESHGLESIYTITF